MIADLKTTSTPLSANYSRLNWSFGHIQKRLAPTQRALDVVHEWLVQGGGKVESVSPNRGFVRVVFDIAAAERCFNVQIRRFVHRKTGTETLCATGAYSVPAAIAPLLDFVAGLNRLPTLHRGFHRTEAIATSFTVNPEMLRTHSPGSLCSPYALVSSWIEFRVHLLPPYL